ncbi:MAG: S-methyl-5'-thioadenosine phosphorylase [Kiritimatiellae bacterium]|nr:S-methyl-5'-thioadenosine phosphorylase [Kiritimatiellia bacterium]
MNKIGIIGGSGLDQPDILTNAKHLTAETPFGAPSSPLTCGTIEGTEIVLIARHGHQHTHTPSGVNYRANIHALKECGCTHILATTACGSLREQIRRGDLVILDQFIDFTHRRMNTFYEIFQPGPENAKHTPMADPFAAELRNTLVQACRELKVRHHERGTVVTIEGPRFSTRAESNMFRIWGADVVNMSIAPEAALANEAGIPYAAVAMATDYDCWKTDEAPVEWSEILRIFGQNVQNVTRLLRTVIPRI